MLNEIKSAQSEKNLYRLLALALLPLLYYVLLSGFKSNTAPVNSTAKENNSENKVIPPGPSGNRNFMNCIFNSQPSKDAPWWIQDNINLYSTGSGDALRFNTIHAYDVVDGNTNGTSDYGIFNNSLSSGQITNINDLTNLVLGANLDFWYERVKISRLCYAQRLIYEVKQPGTGNVNNGFCYSTTSGEWVVEGDGTTAIKASIPHDNTARYVASGIYENLQHGDLYNFNVQYSDKEIWHLKPRLKIPTNTPDNTEVVKIEIFNYNDNNSNGTPIKTILLKARNFKVGGTYNGGYIDEFIFDGNADSLSIAGGDGSTHTPPQLNDGQTQDGWRNWASNCKTDFKVWWCGEVDVWFDKMTVDDEWAAQMFNGDFDDRITDELDYYFAGTDRQYTFFVDELTYSQFEAVKYVKNKINEYCGTTLTPPKLHIASSNYHHTRGHKDNSYVFQLMYDILEPNSVNIDAHEFGGRAYLPHNIPNSSNFGSGWIASNYDNYNSCLQQNVFGDRTTITTETTNITNNNQPPWHGSLVYQVAKAVEQRSSYSPDTKVIIQPQIQAIMYSASSSGGSWLVDGLREPTNEELEAQAMISIAHGADGLCWFWYPSDIGPATTYQKRYPMLENQPSSSNYFFQYGLLNPFEDNYTRRTSNLYNQDKWACVRNMNIKIEKWKPTLDALTWQNGFSIHSESSEAFSYGYIADIKSIYRDPSSPYAFSSSNEDATRYWEMAFFEHDLDGDYNKYFMMVNRRCLPDVSNDGDLRQLKVKFDGSNLINFQNWSVIDVATNQTVVTFPRNSTSYYDFGTFQPGEGKLYRLCPTFVKGGELVTNEDISGKTFTCEDTVLNNGYNVTIDSGTTISFTDSATIIMTGGTFTSGVHGEDNLTTYKGLGSANWNGLRFEGSTVKIYNSKFQDIASPIVNYAVSMVDCPLADIRTNEFVLDTDTAGAVQSVYIEPASPGPVSADLYINYNTITMNQSRGNGISVQGFSALTLPVYIMNNTMSSDGYATGVMLSTITGGAVKKNTITGFSTGVNVLFSSVDFYGNIISNTSSGSKGIMASGSSSLGLVPVSGLWLGGFNEITNTSGTSTNIEVDNSIFILDGGNNSFDISTGNNHLYGSFWDDAYPTNHRYNCFSVSGTDISSPTLPNDFISSGESEDVTLTYLAYTCGGTPPTGTYIADIGNGLYDTIQSSSEGPGGGGVPINNEQLSISNKKSKANSPFEGGVRLGGRRMLTLTASQLYDSARVNMRKRNYQNVKTFCTELINNYPSSHEALSSLQPLYISWMAVDTTQSGVTALKTFYETLILNNGSNTSLVKISNYLVQKCKVSLGSYSSALSGFGQIINNNPYSYEGLLARWDYMATSLLAPQGGAISNEQLSMNNFQFDESYESYKSYESDGPFTKEQKQDIYKSVTTAFEITKNNDDAKIKALEVSSENGNESAANELHHMKVLKELVKTQRPKTMTEHIRTVSSDLQKVFGSTAPVTNIKGGNIPVVFSLSQNYPNPFNPVTTIKYALPKDVKVVIKIYDILGREVRTLVNEIQKTGYYDIKFDGSVYASGVYFYRIEAGDFVQSKKMVLVK